MGGGGAGQEISAVLTCQLTGSHRDTQRDRERERAGSCQECSRSVREPVSVLPPLRDMEKEKFSTATARSEYFISQGFIGIML